MKTLCLTFIVCLFSYMSGCSQNDAVRQVGGGCDGCDLIYAGMPSQLQPETTIVSPLEPGEPMVISGTIFKRDGRTPAPGVIFYVYHTDNKGYYSSSTNQTEARPHGHLRGWIKTGANGHYQFRTIRPAAYPDTNIPAHVHPVVKEPGMTEYYIDEYRFADDPRLTASERAKEEKRGGSGIVKLTLNKNGGNGFAKGILF